MYKKLVVGFAFMVPDVKFNETYISFIFTRPEWRRSGIGSFMIDLSFDSGMIVIRRLNQEVLIFDCHFRHIWAKI